MNAEAEETVENNYAFDLDSYYYYSVEIPVRKLGVLYQYKIWRMESMSSFILVKGDSGLLPCLQVGDILNMKYYSIDIMKPYQNLDTEIRYIKIQKDGRLRGHCIVGIEIMESKHRDKIHWAPVPAEGRMTPPNRAIRNI